MENISIKLRLTGLVVVLIGMMVGIGVFGMVSTHNIIAHLKEDAHKEQELAHTLELAERAEIEFKTQVQEFKNILIRGNDAEYFEKHKKSYDKYRDIVTKEFGKLEKGMKKVGLDPDEVKHVEKLHQEMNHKYETALEKFNRNDPESGKYVDDLVKGISKPVTKAFDDIAHHLSDEIDKVVKQADVYAKEVEASTRNTDIAIIVVAAIVGFGLALVLIRSIINPLNQIIHATERLAEGDMTAEIVVSGKSEISKLQKALATMTSKLRSVVGQVRNSATSVSVSADEIAKGSLDLSSRTEEQAASIEETSSNMEQITEKVQQNSETASQAVELASTATEKAEQGLDVAQSAVNAINEIKASSEQVADIISVIDEIAFQTNLLALNASIEAERAGEQGRGFSVVANEVQKLAQRSADAASEIKQLIKNSTEKVQEGTGLVIRSSQALEEIVKTSKETNDLMQRISEASQEQAYGLSQINSAVAQLEEATQQNAALVEESSAASSSMNDEAKALTRIVSFFKFSEEESAVSTGQVAGMHVVAGSSPQAGEANIESVNENAELRQRGGKTMGNLAIKSSDSDHDDWKEF